MIITTDNLKSAIRRRKTWLAYDRDKMFAEMYKEIFIRKLIDAYDKCVNVSSYGDYSTRGYISNNYSTYSDIVSSVYRPIDSRSIHVDFQI